jgi:DNA-binding transcriptional LysR family regulator
MEIEPRQLLHLLAIARSGSFVRAAESLNISQPALSTSISRLEDVLGIRLMDRGRHGTHLNPSGAALTRHAESLEFILKNAKAEAVAAMNGVAGPLSIGGTPLATNSIIPAIVARLTQDAAPIAINVTEGINEELIRLLERHEIDFAIGPLGLEAGSSRVEEIPLFSARSVVVVRAGHRLAAAPALSLRDLADELWVLPPPSIFRRHIDALFSAVGLPTPVNTIQASPFGVLKEMLRLTDGLTILSDQIVGAELSAGSFIVIPLVEPVAVRSFGLQMLRDRPMNPLAARFRKVALELAPIFDFSPLHHASAGHPAKKAYGRTASRKHQGRGSRPNRPGKKAGRQ